MCVDPATILTTGTAVAGLAMNVVGKSAKYADNSALYIENAENANRALAQTYNQNRTRQLQEADKAQTESFDIVRSMAEAKGKAVAAAADAGVEGVSFANLMSDFEAKEARTRANIDQNYTMAIQQTQSEQEAARERAKSQINSVSRPSQTGLWMDVGADALKTGLKIYDAFDDKPKGKGGSSAAP